VHPLRGLRSDSSKNRSRARFKVQGKASWLTALVLVFAVAAIGDSIAALVDAQANAVQATVLVPAAGCHWRQ